MNVRNPAGTVGADGAADHRPRASLKQPGVQPGVVDVPDFDWIEAGGFVAADHPASVVRETEKKSARPLFCRPNAFLDGGEEEIRTLDPHVANVMLYQLSYFPMS